MRPLRLLSQLVLSALAAPSIAFAIPALHATVPSCISLVGSYGGQAAALGQFTVVVRDIAENPLVGCVVQIDISNCLDLAFCADQLDPAAIVDCGYKRVSKLTTADGSVQFNLLGGSNGAGNAVTLLNGGRVFAFGLLVGTPTISAYDLDGSVGVGAGDLSVWLSDFGTGQPYGRSDYDCNGTIGAGDLSFWLTAFGSGTMAQSCASQCP